jgi:hypothetical protein
VNGRVAAVALPSKSLSVLHSFIGLVYSQFELVKMEFKKVKYNFCYFGELINLMSVMDLLQKLLTPPGLPKQIQLLLRRHHALHTCIPGLQGKLIQVLLNIF